MECYYEEMLDWFYEYDTEFDDEIDDAYEM